VTAEEKTVSSNSEKLLVSLEDGIKRITFNRPERRNSVDFEMFELFADAIRESADDASRVVILSGAGEAFSAGADLFAAGAGDIAAFDVTKHLREHTTPAILGMRALPKPIIARVHGAAVGIGCSYALACDVVIASTQSSFGLGFIKIGLMPDGGSTYFLPRRVGYAKAFELMATGEQIDAAEAERFGLVNRVVAFEELDATVNKLAGQFKNAPQPALAKIKEALNRSVGGDLAAALDFEAVNQNQCFHSPDFREGVAAFMQKRKPIFGQSSRDESD
jgi:2-(1,2-epoxy-1,2-dihydrophenyl)acetyl-CoA isomerase